MRRLRGQKPIFNASMLPMPTKGASKQIAQYECVSTVSFGSNATSTSKQMPNQAEMMTAGKIATVRENRNIVAATAHSPQPINKTI